MPLLSAILGRPGHRGTWSTFILGSFFGFFVASTVSGILSLHIFSDDQTHSIEVTNHALRALASIRHFPETKGWGLVHVFYGNNSHLPRENHVEAPHYQYSKWFGRHYQDFLVHQVLNGKRGGFFVDLTASHAFESSKTYALETHHGWNGLCVDSNPLQWEGLSFRKCDVVGALVGETRMNEERRKHAINTPTVKSTEALLRYTVPLREILERFEAPHVIDYLSIRMEEALDFVLRSFPFDRYRFNVITIERPTADIQEVLERNGYTQLLTLGPSMEEGLWIHQSIQSKVDVKALQKDAETVSSDQIEVKIE